MTDGPVDAFAVIGMAGRFPKSACLEELWANLRDGVECISFFSEAELESAGAGRAALQHPDSVKAHGMIEGVELFDAGFFDFTPREAELLDPQKRLFLETAWEALEHAGYDPGRPPGPVGVYAGVSSSTYLFSNLLANPALVASAGLDQIALGSEKDFLTTLVSYKLNLQGPSIDVQTACSTSLAAVHLACQSLLGYQCDMALAGGVSVKVPQVRGYIYQKGGINSPDGHCRAFDARAAGTVSGSGVGVVALRRLEDALAAGDRIWAVLLGSAMNNDGSGKVGYTAPGVEGQARVIATALALAGVDPATVSCIEAHGTGTPLGDPIEVAALHRVFRRRGARPRSCALGSVKTNLGHLDAAAGIAGLIKTVLALAHRQIPPSLHFEQPNPRIDFAESPFYVPTSLTEWRSDGPRRAGVSSFGIGGTNVHVVLEEAPPAEPPPPARSWQLLLLSARSESALERATDRLAGHLRSHPEQELADAAWTLQAGRHRFSCRRAVVCRDREEAVDALASRDPRRVWSGTADAGTGERPLTFLFPGLGDHAAGMARELYAAVPEFGEELDRCLAVAGRLGLDLRQALLEEAPEPAGAPDLRRMLGRGGDPAEARPDALGRTVLAQPALFAVEHALARLLIRRGLAPDSLLGYSLGEYVAACLAGVFSLEDALLVVIERARMVEELPAGAMLAVPLGEAEIAPLLTGGLGLASVNGPEVCVVAGPLAEVEALEAGLATRGLPVRRLRVAHAFHSTAMEPLRGRLARLLASVRLQPPEIPYLSNVTGTWVRPEEAVDPGFWARHLCQTVRFSEGLTELFDEPGRVFAEVGPGVALSTALLQHPAGAGRIAVPLQPAAWERMPGEASLLAGLGKLWLAGVEMDWATLQEGARRRVPLPTYPFERQRYWVDPAPAAAQAAASRSAGGKTPDLADWFWVPAWRESVPPAADGPEGGTWLLFLDRDGVGEALSARLAERGRVISVAAGDGFARLAEGAYAVDPASAGDVLSLLDDLAVRGALPDRVVHLWSLGGGTAADPVEGAREAQTTGFLSLVFLAQALAARGVTAPLELTAVADGLCDVTGSEVLRPEKATLVGPCLVIPRELPGVTCRAVDVEPRDGAAAVAAALLRELALPPAERLVAWRGRRRWVQGFQPLRIEAPAETAPRVRPGGAYLITGGTGGMGLLLAELLARAGGRPVLLGRSGLPPRGAWDDWLASHPPADRVSRRLRKVREIESLGSEVMVLAADVADRDAMAEALRRVRESLGPIRGVLHAAGTAAGGLMALRSEEDLRATLAPKVEGTLVLADLLRGEPLDFFVLFSSLSSILGGAGHADYCAANAFLDAFAQQAAARGGPPAMAVAWDTWRDVGMAVEADLPDELRRQREQHLRDGIEPAEGVEVFRRLLARPLPRIAVATRPLPALVEWAHRQAEAAEGEARPEARPAHPRPGLRQAYVAPRNEIESALAGIWQEVLGLSSVGVQDPFPELGGHSLLAMRVAARVQKRFGVHLPLRSFFEAPTIAELAVAVVAETARGSDGEDDLDGLLARLEGLSDEEAAALLAGGESSLEGGAP